jgi:putative ABC transport system permease protein
MIKFILKGIIRDKNRSRLPIIIVAIGVMISVFFYCYITGFMGDMISFTAKFSSGHVKIITNGYHENMDISPLDLALDDTQSLIDQLQESYPGSEWSERIQFGGLIDRPDENGETLVQGPAAGLAIDLLSGNRDEIERMNLDQVMVKGSLPQNSGDILMSDQFADKLKVQPGDMVTFIGSTMYGSMTIVNFRLAGTIKFGITLLDRGAIIVDLQDARQALDMQDAASEILGFNDVDYYDDEKATTMMNDFNKKFSGDGEFDPVMIRLRDQNDMGSMIDMLDSIVGIIISIFLLALSIILWNTGLIGGIRRYGEVGLRLAIGEMKGHIYRSMIIESLAIGIVGSFIGTIIGLGFSYLLQVRGFDITGMLKDSTMLFPGVLRAKITPVAFYIGFIPGIISTVLGTMLSGIGIYRRQTASLSKELQG